VADKVICSRCTLEPWEGKVLASIRHAMMVQRKGASVTIRIPPDMEDPNQDLKVKESINR